MYHRALYHPPTTSFPIVLVFLWAGLEVYALFSPTRQLRGERLLIAGLAGSGICLAYLSGLYELGQLPLLAEPSLTASTTHAWLGKLTLISWFFCAAFVAVLHFGETTKRPILFFYRVFLVLLLGLVCSTAYYGGALVFDYGVGVQGPKSLE